MAINDRIPGSDTLPLGDALLGNRICDANLNRSQEALRTLEDLARFRNLSHLQRAYKGIRHQLQDVLRAWDQAALFTSRDAGEDVGRDSKLPSEFERPNAFQDVAAAAAQRLQQSLRSLEEAAKILYPTSAHAIEQIRYQAYDLNASLQLSFHRDLDFLQRARLYVLVDCSPSMEAFQERVRGIAQAGVDLIQIRDKQKDAADILAYAEIVHQAIDPSRTRLIMNDRADLAILSGAYGLHVGQTDLRLEQARKLVSSRTIVGLSTHSVEQVRDAIEIGADYIGCGPTFPSTTKSFDSFSGIRFLQEAAPVAADANLPAFAIGGIDAGNLGSVLEAGFQRVVVGGAIWNSDDPAKATERIRKILDRRFI